jgi:hypothetical protein
MIARGRRAAVDWWRRRRLTDARIRVTRLYDSRADVPDELPRHVVALVGAEGHLKWAIFECPCGRGHQLMLPLQPGSRPHWRFSETPSGPELHPSVDSMTAYRCHFLLLGGRVHWVEDRDPSDDVMPR